MKTTRMLNTFSVLLALFALAGTFAGCGDSSGSGSDMAGDGDSSGDMMGDVPTDTPADTPTDTPADMPVDTPTDTPVDMAMPECGDGNVDTGEECDDQNMVDDDGCTNACMLPACGDSIVQMGEACDDGNMVDDDGCTNACALPTCGDGIVQMGEQCDDQNADNTDACLDTCMDAACGDGWMQVGMEDCDGDNMGTGGESATCNADCSVAVCGDGMVNATAGEDCDGDGMGMGGETATCNLSCTTAACGDGELNVTAMERCDDGNTNDADLCTNMCTTAPEATLTMAHALDTDTGELDGMVQPNFDVATSTWYLTGLTIDMAGGIRISGSNPLTIVVDGNVVIDGILELAGRDGGAPTTVNSACDTAGVGGRGGPGGFAGGVGAGNGGTTTVDGAPGDAPMGATGAGGGIATGVTSGTFGGAGGGGGGHLNPGADGMGNSGGVGGPGGSAYRTAPPLMGGGGGGGGSIEKDGPINMMLDPSDDDGAGGGGGGGAIAIYATGSIAVSGSILANGGNGGSDATTTCETMGAGGGGAGGTILLMSPATTVGGTLDVTAGLGGVSRFGGQSALLNGGDGSDGQAINGMVATITEIQNGTITTGTNVISPGNVVTAIGPNGFYMQDPVNGANSGVWVRFGPDWQLTFGSVRAGSVVTVFGTVAEVNDNTAIVGNAGGFIHVTGSGMLPAAEVVPLADLMDPMTAEPWEGVLVRVENVGVENADEGNGEWRVGDMTSSILIDDQLHVFSGVTGMTLTVGDTFGAIQGPLRYDGSFKIEPRNEADFEGYTDM